MYTASLCTSELTRHLIQQAAHKHLPANPYATAYCPPVTSRHLLYSRQNRKEAPDVFVSFTIAIKTKEGREIGYGLSSDTDLLFMTLLT